MSGYYCYHAVFVFCAVAVVPFSLPRPQGTRNATVFSYVSLLSSFRSMLAETPAPLSVKSPSMAGVITPSKVNQSGRSAVRIQQQQQQQQQRQQKQGKHQVESVLDTSTPSKVAVGHDFRCLALHTAEIVHTKPVLNSTHKTRFKYYTQNPF